jgi:hypothetical protein
MTPRFPALLSLVAAVTLAPGVVRAEVVDEVVAKVNDDIVSKRRAGRRRAGVASAALPRLFRRGTRQQGRLREGPSLAQLIDRRILIQRAGHLFDVNKMQDFFLQQFLDQQNIKTEKDLEKLLAQENMNLADWKKKLVEFFAPQQVLRAEVTERIAISEADAQAYYDAHSAEFTVPAEATVRENRRDGRGDGSWGGAGKAEGIRPARPLPAPISRRSRRNRPTRARNRRAACSGW